MVGFGFGLMRYKGVGWRGSIDFRKIFVFADFCGSRKIFRLSEQDCGCGNGSKRADVKGDTK